uniref:ELMO domain-containing protein n=1 Tax=Megaselia scalaris TaxID=36166 RepID=T1H331_MEGSC
MLKGFEIVKEKEIGHEMAHQLHVLQTLKLGLMESRLRTEWNPQDTESQNKILDLKQRAFREAINNAANNAANSLYPIPNIKEEQYYKKLGFRNTTCPGMDFKVVPPGLLALDCMIYFAINFNIDFTKVIHASAYRTDEHECPFARSSIELIRVLCDVFR